MIARKTWQDVRVMTVAYFLILEFLLVLAVLWWPKIAEDLTRRVAALKLLAPADFLKELIGTWGDHGFAAYIATQQFFKGTNIVGIACAVLIGTGAIAGERETGTLEILLSRPISRTRILWSKFWVLAVCVVVPIFLSSLTIPLLETLVDPKFIQKRVAPIYLLHCSWHAGLFCVMFLAGTLCLSSFIRSQVHVAFAIGAVIIVQVGLYFVQEIRYGSIFMLSDHDIYWPIVAGNRHFWRFFWSDEIWLVFAIVALYAVTHAKFRRMDL